MMLQKLAKTTKGKGLEEQLREYKRIQKKERIKEYKAYMENMYYI